MAVLVALLLSTFPTHAQDQVRIYAAASTAPLLDALKPAFEAETGDTLLIVPAASSVLARQIEAGAEADLFLSANKGWADYVADRNSINTDNRFPLLGNALVLAVPNDAKVPEAPLSPDGFRTLVKDRPLALCDTDAAPCGIYAKQALETLGLWPTAEKAKIIRGANALATTAWLERGEAGTGIIYRTDAVPSEKINIAAPIPPDSHDPIVYDLVVLSPDNPATAKAVSFLTGPVAQDAARSFGFTVPGPKP